MFVSGEGNN